MELSLDEHVKSVLEFMQEKVPAGKLVGVAERLPEMARLLWDRYPQESLAAMSLVLVKTGQESQSQSVSIESSPDL